MPFKANSPTGSTLTAFSTEELLLAKPTNALPAFLLSPTSLVFGAWHFTGEGRRGNQVRTLHCQRHFKSDPGLSISAL